MLLTLALISLLAPADTLSVVRDGRAVEATFEGDPWKTKRRALVGSGVGNYLRSRRGLGEGDFLVRARLTIDEPAGTAAALVLGWDNYFGFDGGGQTFYVNGPWFGGRVTTLGDASERVRAGEELLLEAERRDGRVELRADGEVIHTVEAPGEVGPVGLSPWRATLRVAELSVSGELVDLPELPELVDVFSRGEGYPDFRIPALAVTEKGTLLAFAEGRASLKDHAQNDIVLRRSTDGGARWSRLKVVAEDGDNCLNNPCPVVDRSSGRVLLMYQRYPEGIHERGVIEGVEGDLTCLGFLTYSDDDGRSWSTPRDVTAQIKRPQGATSIAGGPGVGIQLRGGPHAGRLVIPFNEGPSGDWRVYAAFSDDGGETWSHGEVAPEGSPGHGNEVQMVELADGRLMLNSRSAAGSKLRKTAISADGGVTWSPLRDEPQLPESQCQASFLRHTQPSGDSPGRLLFLNPASRTERTRGRLRFSEDDGVTWSAGAVVYPGSFAYSCLGVLPDGRIACLFERDGYARISLALVDLDWLGGG